MPSSIPATFAAACSSQVILLVLTHDEVRIGRPCLAACTSTNVRYRLARLVSLAGVVDEYEAAAKHGSVPIQAVVDVRHVRIAILVAIFWQEAIERIHHDDFEEVLLERFEIRLQRIDIQEPTTEVVDE